MVGESVRTPPKVQFPGPFPAPDGWHGVC